MRLVACVFIFGVKGVRCADVNQRALDYFKTNANYSN